MKPLIQYFCRITGHKWRKPHKDEAADTKVCRRCAEIRPVRKPKAKA